MASRPLGALSFILDPMEFCIAVEDDLVGEPRISIAGTFMLGCNMATDDSVIILFWDVYYGVSMDDAKH